MGSDIKNGKERTNYIYAIKLLIVLFTVLVFNGLEAASVQEKTWVVVIDAGHGGKDPGALGSSSREKNINLAIALKTGEYIKKNLENVKVLYTRENDVFPGLKERADFANKNKADLFISIHANWAASASIKGTETFIMGLSKDEQNLEVAMKENEVIQLEDDFSAKYEGFDPKSPESYIMFTLMQNIYKEQSTQLASGVQNQFRTRAGRVDRGVKQAGLLVLYMTSMPSILIETGFITNPDEEKYLMSKEGQDYIASAIFRATRDYIAEIGKKSVISSSAGQGPQLAEDSASGSKPLTAQEMRFMVQITSSADRKEIKTENFRGISNVTEISSDDRFRYATGNFISYDDALEYRNQILGLYPDAFIIAVRDNKIMPLQEALNSTKIK